MVVGGQTSRLLKKLNVTRKRVLFTSPRQDLLKVFEYKQRLIAQRYTADQLVANDESYVNKGTLNFCYGYSRRGQRCRAKSGTAYTQRRAILGSISTAGLVGQAGIYYNGSTNEDVFLHYLEHKLLPYMNHFYDQHGQRLPGNPAKSVLLLDGASYHRGGNVAQLCDRFGVSVEFLPPYSPEMNPIELLWKAVKGDVRHNRTRLLVERNVGAALLQYVTARGSADSCEGWFEHCGYFALLGSCRFNKSD